MHQTHKVVFLLFDGHLTAIFDATKLPQFLVLPIHTNTEYVTLNSDNDFVPGEVERNSRYKVKVIQFSSIDHLSEKHEAFAH